MELMQVLLWKSARRGKNKKKNGKKEKKARYKRKKRKKEKKEKWMLDITDKVTKRSFSHSTFFSVSSLLFLFSFSCFFFLSFLFLSYFFCFCFSFLVHSFSSFFFFSLKEYILPLMRPMLLHILHKERIQQSFYLGFFLETLINQQKQKKQN